MQISRVIRNATLVLCCAVMGMVGFADDALAKKKKGRSKRAAQSQSKEVGIYSSIVQVAPKKGYIMVTKDGNVMWVKASKAAKPYVKHLPQGEMIDIVVEMRGKKAPIMKSWKLVSGESRCKVFNGKKCSR